MDWALVDRNAECLNLSRDAHAAPARSILTRLPADSHAEFRQLLQEACADGARRRLCVTRPDQPLLLVDILPLHLRESAGPPVLVIISEASEFDSSQERLRRLARRNEAILLSAMDGFFVVDEDCRFLEVNEAFCRMTGYGADELLRMRISDLEVDMHASGGVPSHTRTGLHQFPVAHRHKDGHIIHLEISVNVLHDQGAKILVGFARDVTQRIRAEEEVVRLTRQLKLILDSAADGIVGLDRAGRVTFINPAAARILGCGAEELIGRGAHQIFCNSERQVDDCDTPDCPLCAVLKSGSATRAMDGQLLRRDGSGFPAQCSITAMRSGAEVIGAVLVFRDVTEQRRAEEERRLLEAQVQQGQRLESLGLLAGGIAHDLNNMLAGIQGNACLALSESAAGRDVRERLQRIVGVCERASRVIRQILAYAGHVTCDTSPLALNDLVKDIQEFMRAAVPSTVVLEADLDPGLPIVEADSGQLQQVITSLVVNAVEAVGDRPGRVTLSTRRLHVGEADTRRILPGEELRPGDYACLCVEDTGCGMSPETMQRIFEPFFSKKGPGRGLGLAAVRGVVRAHRGKMRVESEPGRGTRFTILLPAIERPQPAPQDQQQRPAPPAGATLLVIDDDDDVREVIKDMLTCRGLNVLAAENGSRGVELFRRHADAVDVVLLDMVMPGKRGEEVLPELLAIRPDATVIVSSGFSEESVAAQFSSARPAGFIHKPFTPDGLLEKIRSVLEQRGNGQRPPRTRPSSHAAQLERAAPPGGVGPQEAKTQECEGTTASA